MQLPKVSRTFKERILPIPFFSSNGNLFSFQKKKKIWKREGEQELEKEEEEVEGEELEENSHTQI